MDAYATTEQLAAFLYGDESATDRLPEDAARLLDRASEVIADETRTAVYAVDTGGVATDANVLAGFVDATCAQVEFWLAGDEEEDILGPLESASIGGMGQGYGSTNRVTPMYLAPRAARILQIVGLFSGSVRSTCPGTPGIIL